MFLFVPAQAIVAKQLEIFEPGKAKGLADWRNAQFGLC
jgi:hypothetical protein